MKAKLQRDAGSIPKDTEVDIVTKADESDLPPDDEATPEANAQPTYRVKDDQGHTEAVDTRDMKIVR